MLHRWTFALAFLSAGCASGNGGDSGFGNGERGTEPATGGDAATSIGSPDTGQATTTGDSGAPGTFGTTDGSATSNCASGAGAFIYVISDANDLYTFDPTQFPSAAAFTLVGSVGCDSSGVNSMAVDRSATAWVNFNDGKIFKVTTTAPVTCTATSFVPGQGGFTAVLGMGFSVDAAGANDETLFVSDNGGPGGTCNRSTPGPGCTGLGLGTIDPTSMTLTALGAYSGTAAGYNAELTGTGDGKLYGFFTTSPATYGLIDKTSGQTSTPPPTVLPTVNASTGGYAFSFWGGNFYFYTAPKNNTIVTQLNPTTGTTTASPELGFTIVGAGVSTCAPTIGAQ